jgi:hypothetical protein
MTHTGSRRPNRALDPSGAPDTDAKAQTPS